MSEADRTDVPPRDRTGGPVDGPVDDHLGDHLGEGADGGLRDAGVYRYHPVFRWVTTTVLVGTYVVGVATAGDVRQAAFCVMAAYAGAAVVATTPARMRGEIPLPPRRRRVTRHPLAGAAAGVAFVLTGVAGVVDAALGPRAAGSAVLGALLVAALAAVAVMGVLCLAAGAGRWPER